jgi:hypothetical protein
MEKNLHRVLFPTLGIPMRPHRIFIVRCAKQDAVGRRSPMPIIIINRWGDIFHCEYYDDYVHHNYDAFIFWFTFSFVGHQSDDMVYDTNIYKTTNINTKRSDKVKNRNRRTKLAAAASQKIR